MLSLHKAIVTVGGSGYSPIAPGTAGSIVALICYFLLFQFQISPVYFVLLTLAITLISAISVHEVEKIWEHDSGKIVIDEWIGLWVTLAFVPFSYTNGLLALVLFRFFDILKPFGIKAVDTKMHNSFSVILDDILAGVYANIVLQAILYFI